MSLLSSWKELIKDERIGEIASKCVGPDDGMEAV
jgi:hypothetical protein